MCGILGMLCVGEHIAPERFDRMLDTLSHRGPDGRGVRTLAGGSVLIGHRRLAVIDTTPAGAQPMTNEDETVWLSFNGEIYNFASLRKQLIDLGHRFRSDSDTEVIVHAYEQWGEDCVDHLRGIFAFGLWDERRQVWFLARDPIGVKPLYYAHYGARFAFASQPKAILADTEFCPAPDPDGLRDFLAYGYLPGSASAFSGIRKLPPGHTAVFGRNTDIAIRCYWRPCYRPSDNDSFEAAATMLRGKIEEAVRMQMVSDVPIGVFLSGGIDSSLLTAIAGRIEPGLCTFTVGFDERESDERQYARTVSDLFATRHFESVLRRPRMEERLAAMQEHFDEPFDPNGPLPFLELAAMARANGAVVALGGDGGDELFAGYLRYDDFDLPAGLQHGPASTAYRWLRRHALLWPRCIAPHDLERFFAYEGCLADPAAAGIFTDDFLGRMSGRPLDSLADRLPADMPAVAAAQLADAQLYLVDHVLCKVDRASMAHGVEARVPLLDQELVIAAFSVSTHNQYRRGERKALLKNIARDYLPPEIVTDRKKGFSSPLGTWLDERFWRWADRLVADGTLIAAGILRPDCLDHAPQHPRLRWLLVAAELWARRWLFDQPIALPESA
jgi:asparagine synthase (glutamine-hydrolysing)